MDPDPPHSNSNRHFASSDHIQPQIQAQFGTTRPNANQTLPGTSSLASRLHQLPRLASTFPPPSQSSSRPSNPNSNNPANPNSNPNPMIADAPAYDPALPSPTNTALDYNTFWQLQQQYGVGGFRDNLNYAVAQNQNSVTLAPYQEPMYAYNGYNGYGQQQQQQQQQPPNLQQQPESSYYYPQPQQQDYQSPPENAQDYYSPPPQSSIPALVDFTSPPHQFTSPDANAISPPTGLTSPPPHQQPTSAPSSSKQQPKPAPKKKTTTTLKRKRARRKEAAEESSDSEDDEEGGNGRIGKGPDGKPVRLAGACTHCKKLKMKCEFESPMDVVCKRCRNTRHQCIVEGRKPRTQPNKREYLLAQIRQRDQIIEKLVQQIHSPQHISNPSDPPSDPSVNANPDVVAWIQKAQESVRAGHGPFVLDGRADRDTDSVESEDESDIHSGVGNAADLVDDYGLLSPNLNAKHPADREKLHSLPNATAPLGLIAKLALDTRSNRSRSNRSGSSVGQNTSDENKSGENDDVGVANDDYFRPGPAAEPDLRAALMVIQPPEILVHGLVSPQDVQNLFEIFYERLNPFLSMLDPKLHTPESTFSRCPFLFTVICAVSSRYYTAKSSIYPIAMHFAKSAAAKNLIEGWKCVELSQAYILMSLYAMPAKKWEDDRSWLYLGLAIRVATDLNLHHPTAIKTQNELHEREILNRTRTWIILFNLDRSMSTQIGKPSTIREDYIIHNSETWFAQSQYNTACDIHLCYYAQLLRIVARFHEQVYNGPLGIQPDVDVHGLIDEFYVELSAFEIRAQHAFDEALKANPDDAGAVFRGKLTPFLVNYSKLVMFSFGFQKSYQASGDVHQDDVFLNKCVNAGLTVLNVFLNALVPSGFMRFSPDGHFVFTSFACAFLIKLIRTDFIGDTMRTLILETIGSVIDALASPEVAIDDKHTPKLYARFLQNLLNKQTADDAAEQIYSESPSTNADTSTGSTTSTSGRSRAHDFSEGGPQNPSISLEYAPLDGDTRVQLLQRSDGSVPRSTYSDVRNQYDERLSTTSSTIGGDGPDTATQHGDHDHLQQDDMLATMHILSNPGFYDHMLMPPFNPPQWDHLTTAERYQDSVASNYLPPAREYSHAIYQRQ